MSHCMAKTLVNVFKLTQSSYLIFIGFLLIWNFIIQIENFKYELYIGGALVFLFYIQTTIVCNKIYRIYKEVVNYRRLGPDQFG
jgi:hypothetical protein